MVMAVEDEVVGALKKSEKFRKSKKRKERINDKLAANHVYIVKDVGVDGDKSFEEETLTKMKSDNEGVERMKKKKKAAGDNKMGALMEDTNGITVEKAEKKKREREVQSNNIESHAVSQDTANDVSVDNRGYGNSTATEMLESKRKHEKKARTITDGLTCAEGIADFSVNETQASGVGNDNISRKQAKDSSKHPKPKNSKREVRFSNELKVFPESNVPEGGKDQNEVVELIRGKRFSKIEDERVKEAVFKYIETYNLGEEGLDMVLNCKSHPEVKDCWKEIVAAIPNRPYTSVYRRAQILFRRSENKKWSEEDKALILEHAKLNGNKWRSLANKLGRHASHVRDIWLNTDLQWRILEEKKSRHGMLRDNICCTAISNKLSTRCGPDCCWKWYSHLTSLMVAEGKWSDSDDYRLIGALYTLDATCIENVDWDNLVEHRSGELCLKRWKQMVLHIGNHRSKPFSEHVEVLAKRYCPSLIEDCVVGCFEMVGGLATTVEAPLASLRRGNGREWRSNHCRHSISQPVASHCGGTGSSSAWARVVAGLSWQNYRVPPRAPGYEPLANMCEP
nr:DNA-binding protein REB1-like [Ipomoea batatas]